MTNSICHAEPVFEIGPELPSGDEIAATVFAGNDDAILAEFLDGLGVPVNNAGDLLGGVAGIFVELYRLGSDIAVVHFSKISIRKLKEPS